MHHPYPYQAASHRNPVHPGQRFLIILALLALALGSLLLSLFWFGVVGTISGNPAEARGFAFLLVWPVTMLVAWICSAAALLLAKRWLLALVSLPAAVALLLGVWVLVAFFLLNASAVTFTAFFALLNVGAIWLTWLSLRSTAR